MTDVRADALSSALAKLPPYIGPVWRQSPMPVECASEYRVGDVLVELAFLSTTRDPTVVMPGAVTYVVGSRTGKDLSQVAAVPGDAEVVFDRGSLLMVLDVATDASGAVVFLSEVPHPPRPEDLSPQGEENAALLMRLQEAQTRRSALPPEVRRAVSVPDKYAFPVGMSDDCVPRLAVARRS